MASSIKSESDSMNSDCDEDGDFLDPRIQVELERLNTCTDEINKLETELDEANTTFRLLLNESMRRLKVLTCKLGSCIDRARPYYEAVDIAKKAQAECQRAAVKFQRANEIHQAAKETVALAETRFLSNQHEWQFDSAWQEMLNHAIIKVTEAEHQRTESGQEHQKRATLFNVAEQRVAMLEQKLKRTIIKSRPYFEEKVLCQEQLDTQKKRVEELQSMISKVKSDYSGSLKRLEAISEEIHQRRRNKSGSGSPLPRGPREPGVGAELDTKLHQEVKQEKPSPVSYSPGMKKSGSAKWSEDLECELDKFEVCSLGSMSVHTSSQVSEAEDYDDDDLDELRQKVKELSMAEVRSDTWETELAESILLLDNAMLERECNRELRAIASKPVGSPLKEQECNRELTAIALSRSKEDLLESENNNESLISLHSALVEEEARRSVSQDSNGIQQLSAVALNKMISENGTNTADKPIDSPKRGEKILLGKQTSELKSPSKPSLKQDKNLDLAKSSNSQINNEPMEFLKDKLNHTQMSKSSTESSNFVRLNQNVEKSPNRPEIKFPIQSRPINCEGSNGAISNTDGELPRTDATFVHPLLENDSQNIQQSLKEQNSSSKPTVPPRDSSLSRKHDTKESKFNLNCSILPPVRTNGTNSSTSLDNNQ